MKLKILVFFFILMFSSCENNGIDVNDFLLTYGYHVIPTRELPHCSEWIITDSQGQKYHGDLGIMIQQVRLFTIPIWNYSAPKYVLFTNEREWNKNQELSNFRRQYYTKEYLYYELSEDEMNYLNFFYPEISKTPELSFWQRIGGKVCIMMLLLLYLAYEIYSNVKPKKSK